MEPSGERCEVPVVKAAAVPRGLGAHDGNDVAEVEKGTEHQYVFSGMKVDGSKAQHERPDPEPPRTAAAAAKETLPVAGQSKAAT